MARNNNNNTNNGGNNANVANGVAARLSHIEMTNDPYYLNPGDNSNSSLVNPVLTGPNFHSWKRAMEIALGSKGKLVFVEGTLICPLALDLMYNAWNKCNLVIQSWILNSVSAEIAQSILYEDTAHVMWMKLKNIFSQGNDPRIYEVQQTINHFSQGTMSVSAYFTQLETHWQELQILSPIPRCSCAGSNGCNCNFMEAIVQREEKFFQMHFLMGLNDKLYSSVRGQILLMRHVPSLNEMYALVIQEEKQRSLKNYTASPDVDSMVMASTHNAKPFFKGKGIQQCTYCNKSGHTKDKCFKLHGFPPGWKSKNSVQFSSNHGQAYANQVNTGIYQPGKVSDIVHMVIGVDQQPVLSQNQMQQLYAFMQSQMQEVKLHSKDDSTLASTSQALPNTPFSHLAYTGVTGPHCQEDDWPRF